jgi:hypothetical protein
VVRWGLPWSCQGDQSLQSDPRTHNLISGLYPTFGGHFLQFPPLMVSLTILRYPLSGILSTMPCLWFPCSVIPSPKTDSDSETKRWRRKTNGDSTMFLGPQFLPSETRIALPWSLGVCLPNPPTSLPAAPAPCSNPGNWAVRGKKGAGERKCRAEKEQDFL